MENFYMMLGNIEDERINLKIYILHLKYVRNLPEL